MQIRGLLCTVLIGLTVSDLAVSQEQVLDSGFGKSGVVRLEAIQAKFVPKAATDPQGRIVLSGETLGRNQTIVRLQPNGLPDQSFGNNGVLQMKQLGQVLVDAQSRVLLIQAKQVLRFKSNGLLDTSYGKRGVFTIPTGTKNTVYKWQKAVLVANGSLWLALQEFPKFPKAQPDENDNQVVLVNVLESGRLNTGIGKNGFAANDNLYPNMRIHALVKTPNDGVAVVSSANLQSPAGVSTYEPPIWLHRFNQKGQLETESDLTRFTCTNGGYTEFFGLRSDNSAVFIASNSGDCNTFYRIVALDAKNEVQAEFGQGLPEEGTEGAALVQSQNGILLLLDPKISSLSKAFLTKDGSLLFLRF